MPLFPSSLTRPQRLLLAFGVVTALSAFAHVLVWLMAGMPSLVGPVTWRKPIVFGLSITVLSWSLAWVVRHLANDRRLTRETMALVALLGVELLMIDMQQWRGVTSHFNTATAFDGAVFQAMGIIILAAAGILAAWTWRLFRHPRPGLPREHLTAARAGMLLLAAGNAIGIFLAVWGTTVLQRTGQVPAAFGAAGNVKLTHAVALHALQVLPLIAVALGAVAREGQRVAAMRRAVMGYALVLGWTLWQAAAGRPPELVTWPSAWLLTAGIALLAWTTLAIGQGAVAHQRMPRRVRGIS